MCGECQDPNMLNKQEWQMPRHEFRKQPEKLGPPELIINYHSVMLEFWETCVLHHLDGSWHFLEACAKNIDVHYASLWDPTKPGLVETGVVVLRMHGTLKSDNLVGLCFPNQVCQGRLAASPYRNSSGRWPTWWAKMAKPGNLEFCTGSNLVKCRGNFFWNLFWAHEFYKTWGGSKGKSGFFSYYS